MINKHRAAEEREVSVPWAYADDLYQLRMHIQYVRDNLATTGELDATGDSLHAAAGGR